MNLIEVQSLDDPRLADYADIRERQLAEEFRENPLPGRHGGDPAAPHGKFMAEGELVLERLVRSPFPVLSILCTPARLKTIAPSIALLPEATPVYLIRPEALESLVGFPLHRGLMAIAARLPPRSLGQLLDQAGEGPLLVLEDLANHDNIGALFRNAAAFGVRGVVLSPQCADPLYRKATRVAVGHTLTTPFARAADWPADLALLHARGYQTWALTPQEPSRPLREACASVVRHPGPLRLALLVGAEGPGLSAPAMASATQRVCIPMAPGVDSLNVAVASAVALEHVRHALNGA